MLLAGLGAVRSESVTASLDVISNLLLLTTHRPMTTAKATRTVYTRGYANTFHYVTVGVAADSEEEAHERISEWASEHLSETASEELEMAQAAADSGEDIPTEPGLYNYSPSMELEEADSSTTTFVRRCGGGPVQVDSGGNG